MKLAQFVFRVMIALTVVVVLVLVMDELGLLPAK